MRRHLLPLLALVALPLGLLAGCGGGNVGGHATSGTTSAATTGAQTTSSGTARASKTKTSTSTTATRREKPSPHAFAAAKITPPAAHQLAKSGQLVLPVATGGPGTVRAFGQAEIPGKGIIHVADARPMVVKKAGIVDLRLILTPVARAQLAAGRGIDMFVAIWFSHGNAFEREEVHLKP